MTSREIINEMKQDSNAERLAIVEEASRLIREELDKSTRFSDDNQVTSAARALMNDYLADRELTAFTSLDSEDFRA